MNVRMERAPETGMRWHPYAELFPWIEGHAFEEFKAEIDRNGVVEPIVMHEGMLLDGRNRYMAARDLGIEYPVVDYDGEDALSFVIAKNIARRHLTESQRAMAAVKVSKVWKSAEGSPQQTQAALARWDREEEIKRLQDDETITFDQRAYFLSMLRARHSRQDRADGKRASREVYLARAGKMVKIGVSSFPKFRMEQLAVAQPDIVLLKSWPGSFSDEKHLHKLFADRHINGEWFEYSDELADIVDEFMRNRQLADTHSALDASAEILSVGKRSVERAAVVESQGLPEVAKAVEQGELAVSAAEKIARLPQDEQPAALEKALPSGYRAIMGSRQEPDDSLDFFPTPPWATRALVERVLRGAKLPKFELKSVWEPACGEGHIAEVLEEYGLTVFASDVHDYGYGDFTSDFLGETQGNWPKPEWIITNPPFGDKGEKFVLRALNKASVGVAMFVRMNWLETVGRYENVFKNDPPTLISFFAERVNLCKGRWEPDGSTATAYVWLIWLHGEKPRAPFWIPPGCREALSKPDDAERFTAHPVKKQLAQAAE